MVLLEPGKLARVADIDASLEGCSAWWAATSKGFYPYEEQVCIVCNDEGKINGLDLNRAIRGKSLPTWATESSRLSFRKRSAAEHRTGYIVFTEDSFDKPYSGGRAPIW